jgi:CYTH domain-containing protein/CHAD domain-containing protein
MAHEIERKFLIAAAPAWLDECEGVEIEQGYLAVTKEVEVRLRRSGEETLLTVKGGQGDVREEIEMPLPSDRFRALWPLTKGRRLAKTRRLVPLGDGLTAEVDVFGGDLAGLVVAEVEFDSRGQEQGFEPPGWAGKELTGNEDYSGQSLASSGLPAGRREKQRGYRLKKSEPVPDGVRRIACGRAETAIERLEGTDATTAIHGARKDLKKLRAVLRLVRDQLGDDLYRRQNKLYRDVGRMLSEARDAEVKVETLAALREWSGSELPDGPAAAWRLVLERERDELLSGAGEKLSSQIEDAASRIAAGRDQIAAWPLDDDSWELLEPGLLRSYRRARRAMKQAQSSEEAVDVHEWRKRTKDLWYHLRVVRGAWKPVVGEMSDQAHQLANLLGDHHDLTVLLEDLKSRDAIDRSGGIGDQIGARQQELLKKARKVGARLFAEKPNAFRRRFRAYWLVWR